MNKSEYQRAYQFVRATMEANSSDLDYQTATCRYRQQCAENDYPSCACDYDGYLFHLRTQAIEQIRGKGLTFEGVRVAAKCYADRTAPTPSRIQQLRYRLQVASKAKGRA